MKPLDSLTTGPRDQASTLRPLPIAAWAAHHNPYHRYRRRPGPTSGSLVGVVSSLRTALPYPAPDAHTRRDRWHCAANLPERRTLAASRRLHSIRLDTVHCRWPHSVNSRPSNLIGHPFLLPSHAARPSFNSASVSHSAALKHESHCCRCTPATTVPGVTPPQQSQCVWRYSCSSSRSWLRSKSGRPGWKRAVGTNASLKRSCADGDYSVCSGMSYLGRRYGHGPSDCRRVGPFVARRTLRRAGDTVWDVGGDSKSNVSGGL
jgi:hypothetical protein